MHDGTVHEDPTGQGQTDPFNPYGYSNPYARMVPTDFEYNPFTGSYVSASTGQMGASGGPSIASGGAGIIGGIASLVGSRDRIADAQAEYNKAKTAIEDFYSEAEGKYDRSLSQTTSDAYNLMAGRKTNIDPILSRQAQNFNVLESADPRALLSGLGAVTDPSAILAARESDFQNTVAAMTAQGAAEQSIADSNLQRQYELDLRKLGYSEEAARTAAQNKAAEEQARRQAFGQIGQGVLETGLSFFVENGGKMNFYRQGGKTFPDYSGDGEVTQKDILMGKGVIPKPDEEGNAEHGKRYPGGGMMPRYPGGGMMHKQYGHGGAMHQEYGHGGAMHQEYGDGGAMKYMMGGSVLDQIMGGGKGQPPIQGPFPGEPSHTTNPIHMINKNGEKVGEAMGGEVMLNDQQGSAMMDSHGEIKGILDDGRKPSDEEWMAYFQAMESILGQPQFKEVEQVMA